MNRVLGLLVMWLALISNVNAQPWEWRRDTAYLNPSGIYHPQQYLSSWGQQSCIGDINGDGDLELLDMGGSGTEVSEYTPVGNTRLWTTILLPNQNFLEELLSANFENHDFDGDGVDEIIGSQRHATASHCWRTVSDNPWSWERADSFLLSLSLQDSLFDLAIGDYNGNGLLDKVEVFMREEIAVEMSERDADGAWNMQMDFSLPGNSDSRVVDGDFDGDGDTDFGYLLFGNFLDLTNYRYFFAENTGNGITSHELSETTTLWSHIGGDLDGDGDWEGLAEFQDSPPGLNLVDVGVDSMGNLVTEQITQLTMTYAMVLGQFRIAAEPKLVFGINRRGLRWIPAGFGFFSAARAEASWQEWHGGLGFARTSYIVGGGSGDLTGDGRDDYLALMRSWVGNTTYDFSCFVNVGNAEADSFVLDTVVSGWFQHELNITDYSQVNSVSIGTLGAEATRIIAVTKLFDNISRARIYSVTGDIRDTLIVYRPELASGLPLGIAAGQFADLNADGISEFLTRVGTRWDIYFWRNEMWEIETRVLPNFSAASIGFADLDDDGDEELITPAEVWWNESELGASEHPKVVPTDLSLSAYPNPFNGEVSFSYNLELSGRVSLIIYDLVGRRVQTLLDRVETAGPQVLHWDAAGLTSGVYFAKLQVGDREVVTKVLLLK